MTKKWFVLLRTMMTSCSNRNVLKYSLDKKKKRSARLNLFGHVGAVIIGTLLIGGQSFGMAHFGFADAVPGLVATVLTILAIILTLFKSNGYLYAFKEYDMLMAMPFSVRTVVSDRFLLMYLQSLPWNMMISLAALLGYAIEVHPSVWVYLSWIILTPIIPLLPTAVMSLLGVLVADIGSRFRYKRIVQIILTFVIFIPLIFSRFFFQSVMQNNQLEDLMKFSSKAVSGITTYLPTAHWFERAVNDADVLSLFLLIVVSLAVYLGMVFLIGRTYRRINSRLEVATVRRRGARVSPVYKQKSILQSIAFCEFKRITGSANCAVNLLFGTVIALVVGVVIPFIDVNHLISVMAKGKTFDIAPFRLVWPVLVFFFLGMVPTTVPSPSLEGKSYWILKSLPIDRMTVFKGKMLLNIYLNLLPGLFVVTTGLFALRADWWEYIAGLCMITVMCLFSTVRGMKCGIRHINLDWENELDVVKRGAAVTVYLLPNMLATLLLMGLMGVVSFFVSKLLGAAVIILVYALLTLWNYLSLKKTASGVS